MHRTDLIMHDLLACYWVFVWLWLDHSVGVEFKGRKSIKLLCKMAYEHTDRNTLEFHTYGRRRMGMALLLAVECNRYLEGDMSI